MRIILALTTAMLAAIMPSQAWAEPNWVFVVQKEIEAHTYFRYVDTNSIRRTGEVARYWEHTDYMNDRRGWKRSLTLYENNCATDRWRMLQLTLYFVDGQVSSHPYKPNATWLKVAPETVGETVHNFVCGK